jgi:DNA-binding PadR family transcriptional regulator
VVVRIECCGQTCELPTFVDLRGMLSFWLLWELRLGPLVGAQLAERMAWRRGEPMSPGTLYPALAALAKHRLVQKTANGRETSYRLTPKGESELRCAATYVRIVFGDVVDGPRLVQIKGAARS